MEADDDSPPTGGAHPHSSASALLARLALLLHLFRPDNTEANAIPQPPMLSGLHPRVLFARLSSLLPRSRFNAFEETEPHPTSPLGSHPDALMDILSSVFRSQPHTSEEIELPQRASCPDVVKVVPMRDREVLFVAARPNLLSLMVLCQVEDLRIHYPSDCWLISYFFSVARLLNMLMAMHNRHRSSKVNRKV